jgi:hypothetical protein
MEIQLKSGVIYSHRLLRNVSVEDFLHGQGDDDFTDCKSHTRIFKGNTDEAPAP